MVFIHTWIYFRIDQVYFLHNSDTLVTHNLVEVEKRFRNLWDLDNWYPHESNRHDAINHLVQVVAVCLGFEHRLAPQLMLGVHVLSSRKFKDIHVWNLFMKKLEKIPFSYYYSSLIYDPEVAIKTLNLQHITTAQMTSGNCHAC